MLAQQARMAARFLREMTIRIMAVKTAAIMAALVRAATLAMAQAVRQIQTPDLPEA